MTDARNGPLILANQSLLGSNESAALKGLQGANRQRATNTGHLQNYFWITGFPTCGRSILSLSIRFRLEGTGELSGSKRV